MTPFYQHLSGMPGFGAASNLDTIGLAVAVPVWAPRSPATGSFRS